MLEGTPVIGTRRGGTVELIEDGKNGLLFEPGNIDELASKIRLLLRDDSLRREMGIRSQEVAARFTVADQVMRPAYEAICGLQGCHSPCRIVAWSFGCLRAIKRVACLCGSRARTAGVQVGCPR